MHGISLTQLRRHAANVRIRAAHQAGGIEAVRRALVAAHAAGEDISHILAAARIGHAPLQHLVDELRRRGRVR